MTKIKFEAANQEQCTAQMRKLCDDGRAWTVAEVFGLVTATPYATAANVPRTPASTDSEMQGLYWHAGGWHKRRPATAAMERKVQREADTAAGVSDGGGVSDATAVRRWFRARARKDAKRLQK